MSLADTVSIDDDSVRLEAAGRLVEHHQVLLDHGRQLLNDFNPVGLDSNRGRVPRRVRVLAANHRGDGRLLVVSGRRVRDVGSQEDDRLAEDLWPDSWHENGVDTAKFDVDLQAEVGQRLRRRLVHVLGLEKVSTILTSFCSTDLPLARTRWVQSTFSSPCPLSSNQHH